MLLCLLVRYFVDQCLVGLLLRSVVIDLVIWFVWFGWCWMVGFCVVLFVWFVIFCVVWCGCLFWFIWLGLASFTFAGCLVVVGLLLC